LGGYAILHLLIGMLSHIPWLRSRTAEWSKYRVICFIKAVHQVKISETVAMVFPYPLFMISLLERNNWLALQCSYWMQTEVVYNKEIISVGCFCLWNLQKDDFEGFLILNDAFLKSHFVLKESCI
jgi:hypothetical protein